MVAERFFFIFPAVATPKGDEMKEQKLTKENLKVGKLYRAKRYRKFWYGNNDRIILWMSDTELQYDSNTIRQGWSYPKTSIEKFLKWAKCEVIEEKK